MGIYQSSRVFFQPGIRGSKYFNPKDWSILESKHQQWGVNLLNIGILFIKWGLGVKKNTMEIQ
jgi:hypothetical protein